MSKSEAQKTKSIGGLVLGETNGKVDKRAKWINLDGSNYNATTQPKPTHRVKFEITKEGYDMLKREAEFLPDYDSKESTRTDKIMKKENEPGACGIGANRISDFNKYIKNIVIELISGK